MIAKLRGRVDQVGEDFAVIDVGGVGYLAYCGARTLSALRGGETAELAVETHVREDHIHLYGFSTNDERAMFRSLTTVQGVGAKVALAILSALSPEQVVQAIAAGDAAPFRRAGGVGPKLAARIVGELKDRLPAAAAAAAAPLRAGAEKPAGDFEDAVSALVNLGYGRIDAFGAVSRAAQAAGGKAPLNVLIRAALRALGAADG